LLARTAEEASSDGWISANVNAAPDMLDELLIPVLLARIPPTAALAGT